MYKATIDTPYTTNVMFQRTYAFKNGRVHKVLHCRVYSRRHVPAATVQYGRVYLPRPVCTEMCFLVHRLQSILIAYFSADCFQKLWIQPREVPLNLAINLVAAVGMVHTVCTNSVQRPPSIRPCTRRRCFGRHAWRHVTEIEGLGRKMCLTGRVGPHFLEGVLCSF